MPAADSYPALFNQQRIIEDAFAAYLTANGLSAFTSRGSDDMTDSRVELLFEVGPSQGHAAPASVSHTGEKENDLWIGTINFAVQTERAAALPSPVAGFDSLHEYRVSLLQALMLRGAMNGKISGFTALSLPYYSIAAIERQGVADDIPEDGFDRTLLAYSVQYRVRDDAWPANTLPD